MRGRSEAIYRFLLRAYPKRTRDASGDDMVQLFAERLREAGSAGEKAGLWLQVLVDLALTAPRERLASRLVAVVAEGPANHHARSLANDLGWASMPLLIMLLVVSLQPPPLAPMFDIRVGLLGLPAGVAILSLAAAVASVAIVSIRRRDQLSDPALQALLMCWLLIPAPALLFVVGAHGAVAYAFTVTLFALAARYRLAMLALILPFVLWLAFGPALIPIIIGLGNSSGP